MENVDTDIGCIHVFLEGLGLHPTSAAAGNQVAGEDVAECEQFVRPSHHYLPETRDELVLIADYINHAVPASINPDASALETQQMYMIYHFVKKLGIVP